MPRPIKWRRIDFIPPVTHFKPAGIPLRSLEEVNLTFEEVEAIRLKDLEGLEQEDCAQRMRISRPTFHRVLGSARRKIADSLLNGKAVRIQGGNFEMSMRRFRCMTKGHEWDIPFDDMITGSPPVCPRCQSTHVQPAPGSALRRRLRGGRRGGGGRQW